MSTDPFAAEEARLAKLSDAELLDEIGRSDPIGDEIDPMVELLFGEAERRNIDF